MKAGIITYHNAINYGAALQALALQESICEIGVEAEIINYTPKDVFANYKPLSFRKLYIYSKNSLLLALRTFVSDLIYFGLIKKKNTAFDKFGNKYFKYSGKAHLNLETLKEALPEYDVCFAGSDQIWNPDITYGFDSAYFLNFGKENMIRASYAASIGRDSFSKNEQDELSRYLKGFDFISTREKTACDVISDLTDKPVSVDLDPTLLIPAEKWTEILSIDNNKGGYIFVYTLYPNPELDTFVEKLSKLKDLQVITVNRRKIYSAEKESFPNADPEKFVELIANADYVVTNSFHGTAFSVNFSKNFITFMGNRRNSRMTDLLGTLGISERVVAEYSDELLDMPDIDYISVQNILAAEREKSKSYIKSVLERAEKT